MCWEEEWGLLRKRSLGRSSVKSHRSVGSTVIDRPHGREGTLTWSGPVWGEGPVAYLGRRGNCRVVDVFRRAGLGVDLGR